MFHSDHIFSHDRVDPELNGEPMLWALIPSAVQDGDNLNILKVSALLRGLGSVSFLMRLPMHPGFVLSAICPK
jgi:hypothetical protein